MAKTCVLVCVTVQRNCERLIRIGAELAQNAEGSLSVVHVARKGQRFLGSEDEAAALEYLFQVSRESGADMTLLHSDDVCSSIASMAEKCRAEIIVLGAPPEHTRGMQLPSQLRARLPGVDVKEIITTGD